VGPLKTVLVKQGPGTPTSIRATEMCRLREEYFNRIAHTLARIASRRAFI